MLFCLASGAAFGAMAVFGKLAYAEGATVGTLLALRFLFASGLFWAGAAISKEGQALFKKRDVWLALGLGAGGYAVQAGLYFAALSRIDAGLLSLLVFTFPVIVAVAAVALGRERLTRRRTSALAIALGGTTLFVGSTGAIDTLGVVLGLGAAVLYSAYILVSEGIAQRMPPQLLATLVCTGAAAALTVSTIALGEFRPGNLSLAGWWWLLCLAGVDRLAELGVRQFIAGVGGDGSGYDLKPLRDVIAWRDSVS
jgi:drug/metabolite transporter (DMT)-like permease